MPDRDVYRELQEDLDRMPVGFPATPSGVEIRILKQLFTPTEARIALCLSMAPEPLPIIHRRLDLEITPQQLGDALSLMEYRGLIRTDKGPQGLRYAKMPFVIGIYEGQVNRMSEPLARDLLEYFDQELAQAIRPKTTPQLRTVPINQPIPIERTAAQYDDIRTSVRSCEGPFAVMNCICRQAKDLAGQRCRQTAVRENCLTMGSAAKVMLRHGQARPITRERMLELLDEADREGLVLQPQNTRNPLFICCCCGCCCVALEAAKKHEHPAEFFSSNYYAEVDAAVCESCGECINRCQMEAISQGDFSVNVDLTHCIGCGICISTCPSGAMTLKAKDEAITPPAGTSALYAKIYRERYGTLGFAKTAVRMFVGQKA